MALLDSFLETMWSPSCTTQSENALSVHRLSSLSMLFHAKEHVPKSCGCTLLRYRLLHQGLLTHLSEIYIYINIEANMFTVFVKDDFEVHEARSPNSLKMDLFL